VIIVESAGPAISSVVLNAAVLDNTGGRRAGLGDGFRPGVSGRGLSDALSFAPAPRGRRME
jgi:hypothetical protein